MIDILYTKTQSIYDAVMHAILLQYPTAQFNQQFGDMEVSIENLEERDWLKYAIPSGVLNISFQLRPYLHHPDKIKITQEVIDEIKRERAAKNSIVEKIDGQ